MEIKSIHIDCEKNLLEINGKAVNKPTVVYLPSDTPGWYNSKLLASPEGSKPKAYDQIKVVFKSDQQ